MSARNTRIGAPAGPDTGWRTPAVLLVASAQDDRAMYAEYLRVAGFRAIEIDDTADALALAITADVVVTGIRVPGPFDGVELVRRLRAAERTAGKPVIVLTACVLAPDEQRARDAGCDRFLAKPCLPMTLVAELRRVLKERRRRARRRRVARNQTRRDIA